MAPLEGFQARDLEWISDFVMQQVVIMLRPMMEHLQQTDVTIEYSQHAVQRLSMDVSEVRSDLERTNKYLAILRQGLGVQNEGRCVLQRGVENATRAAKRLDDQMEALLDAVRGTEGKLSGHDDLARQVAENSAAIDDLMAKVERGASDAHALRDTVLSGEERLEVWQRELRELRRHSLLGGSKQLEEKSGPPPSSQGGRSLGAVEAAWPQKKSFTPMEVGSVAGVKDGSNFVAAASGSSDRASAVGGSQQSKRMNRTSSSTAAKSSLLSQDQLAFGAPPQDGGIAGLGDEPASTSSRLPVLAARQGSMTRPPEGGYSESRKRFSATMADRTAGPPSRGAP